MAHFSERPDLAAIFSALDSRVSRLETISGLVPVDNGPPKPNQRDGALYGDKAGSFFYIVLGGVAKKVAVA